MKQRSEARLHPFAISQPVPLTEKLLSDFGQSPTAKIYLQALKQVKEGFEVLQKSNFTNERGITLIAHGYLTENSILQAFPADVYIIPILPQLFQLCEKTLEKNPYFFEALVVSFALQAYERKLSMQGSIGDMKKIMCIDNLIHFIKNAEPDGVPCKNPSMSIRTIVAGFIFCITSWEQSLLLEGSMQMQLRLMRTPFSIAVSLKILAC